MRTPKIEPKNNNGSIRLRFIYQGVKYQLNGLGSFNNATELERSRAIASKIRTDILTGDFDSSLDKYRLTQHLSHGIDLDLLDLIKHEITLDGNVNKIPVLKQVETALEKLEPKKRLIRYSKSIGEYLLDVGYSKSTVHRMLSELRYVCNKLSSSGVISPSDNGITTSIKRLENKKHLKTTNKRCYSDETINLIIDNIRSIRYKRLIQFIALSGCRVSEGIALEWDDVNWNDKTISISKTLSSRNIVKETKTKVSRLFPLTDELHILLQESLADRLNDSPLVFPSPKGKYIGSIALSQRIYRPVVDELIAIGEVNDYLPLYNLRHACASRLMRLGIDIETIGSLLGTSSTMLQSHYLAPNTLDSVLQAINSKT